MPVTELRNLDGRVGAVLSGAASPESLPSGLQASLQRAVYLLAKGVLALGSNAGMKQALDALPESVRPLVAAECRRLTDYEKGEVK